MNKIEEISIEQIGASPRNPRKTFSDEALAELATSIRELGILQPITVRAYKHIKGERYEIVCGERRYRAAKIAGLDSVPCIVRELTDEQAFDAMITENLQRKDVDVFEEAFAFAELLKVKGNDVVELSKRFGKSERFIRERVKLNSLIPAFKQKYERKEITLGMALELAKLDISNQEFLVDGICWNYCTTLVDLKSRLSKVDLNNALFGLDEKLGKCVVCKSCEYNTASALTLFAETNEKAVCMNQSCFNIKQRTSIINKVSKDKEHLRLVMQSGPNVGERVEELILDLKVIGVKVYPIYDLYTEWEEMPDVEDEDEEDFNRHLKRYTSLLEAEDTEEVYMISYYGTITWRRCVCKKKRQAETEDKTVAIESDEEIEVSESMQELLDKKERYKKVRDENVVLANRSFMNEHEKDYVLGALDMATVEYNVLHTLMLKRCSSEVLKYLNIDPCELASLDLLPLVRGFNESQKQMIRRGFIHSMATDGTAVYNRSTQDCLDAVMRVRFGSDKEEIEQRFDAVLNKRIEKLDSQINSL